MKLKPFTPQETVDLINDLDQYWKLCAEVTAIARFRIEEGFNTHQRDYRWDWKSPFTRKVKTLSDMTRNISGGQFRTVANKFVYDKGFVELLSFWYGDSNPKYYFVQDAYNDIVIAAGRVGNWKMSHIATFHELVEKYAIHPLVPEEHDIEIIKSVRQRITILNDLLDAYHNAI